MEFKKRDTCLLTHSTLTCLAGKAISFSLPFWAVICLPAFRLQGEVGQTEIDYAHRLLTVMRQWGEMCGIGLLMGGDRSGFRWAKRRGDSGFPNRTNVWSNGEAKLWERNKAAFLRGCFSGIEMLFLAWLGFLRLAFFFNSTHLYKSFGWASELLSHPDFSLLSLLL